MDRESGRKTEATSTFVKQIVHQSRSNLAAALFLVRPQGRDAVRSFYTFCRLVDDIADCRETPSAEKRMALESWRASLHAEQPREHPFAARLRQVIAEHAVDLRHVEAVIDGVLMDLEPLRFQDFAALREYCLRVASAVGLVSLRFFGCPMGCCEGYARDLGIGLQIINIVRDVGEDWANGKRLYLPCQDLEATGYTEQMLAERRLGKEFLDLMRLQARRARAHIHAARASIPAGCRHLLKASRLMDAVYSALLTKMETDGFQVFQKRYKLSKATKLLLTAGVMWTKRFPMPDGILALAQPDF